MPSEIEILIHKHLMGGCVHPDFDITEERSYGYTHTYVVCIKCGKSAPAPFRMHDQAEPTNDELLACLKATIPPYCLDLATSRGVLRHLEAHGWRWAHRGFDGLLEYTLTRGNLSVTGEPAKLEHTAVVNVISKLARKICVA
jgi:hypothetical protein